MAVRAPGNAALLGNGPQTRVYGHSDSSAVVMGKRPITSIFLDRGTLVHGPRHHEMGVGLYFAPGVAGNIHGCLVVMGIRAIPNIHIYRESLEQSDHRNEVGLGLYSAPRRGRGVQRWSMARGEGAIPGIQRDRQPLGHDPYRRELGLGLHSASCVVGSEGRREVDVGKYSEKRLYLDR